MGIPDCIPTIPLYNGRFIMKFFFQNGLTCVLGIVLNFSCSVTYMSYGVWGYGYNDLARAYSAFALIAALVLCVEAYFIYKKAN